jgi:hypothetical protein
MRRLTDDQIDQIARAAAPLPLIDQQAFRKAVEDLLNGLVQPGDGDVFRAVREAQRRFWRPPLVHPGHKSKYR